MVKHVILWTLKEGYSPEEIAEIKKGVKSGLEGLKGICRAPRPCGGGNY